MHDRQQGIEDIKTIMAHNNEPVTDKKAGELWDECDIVTELEVVVSAGHIRRKQKEALGGGQ